MPGKEQPAPECIERELRKKKGERGLRRAKAANTPYQPGGNAHQGIQRGPDRPEDPGRRRPVRANELGIERTSLNGCRSPYGRGDKADNEPARQANDLLVFCKR